LLGLSLVVGRPARAESNTAGAALDRLREILELRVAEGGLSPDALRPAVLVSAVSRDPANQSWYVTKVIDTLQPSLGPGGLRMCEACMAPRAFVDDGQMTYQTGPIALDEIVLLDDRYRGTSEPARVAIWVDEQQGGVSARFVDLRTGRLVFAQNVDPYLAETQQTARVYTLAEEIERRARGDSLTQAFADFAAYPGQHVSLEWTDQWGSTNRNLSGVVISLFDPVVGIGAAHHRCTDVLDLTVGVKVIMSMPTAVVRVLDENGDDVLDPLVTAVGVIRVPFGRSNYGALFTASTNGQVGIGISLMNVSLVPVMP